MGLIVFEFCTRVFDPHSSVECENWINQTICARETEVLVEGC